jgi:hypothetical protein
MADYQILKILPQKKSLSFLLTVLCLQVYTPSINHLQLKGKCHPQPPAWPPASGLVPLSSLHNLIRSIFVKCKSHLPLSVLSSSIVSRCFYDKFKRARHCLLIAPPALPTHTSVFITPGIKTSHTLFHLKPEACCFPLVWPFIISSELTYNCHSESLS